VATNDSSAAFSALAADFLADPGVDEGTGFGSNPGLRVDGKIFAMVVRGDFVVKLPAERCDELVDAGRARRFRIGSREMREWIAVEPGNEDDWPSLAREALDFVRG
jgi:hypothetical protein